MKRREDKMETRTRTLAKALSWQGVGLATMTAIGFAFTGSASAGGALALVSAAVGLVAYMAHERVWGRIGWGRVQPASSASR